jgi:hypothetical protein
LRGKNLRAKPVITAVGDGVKVEIWVGFFDKDRKGIDYLNSYDLKQTAAERWLLLQWEPAASDYAEFAMYGASPYEKDGPIRLDAIETSVY